jgi:DNA-directed RNA polymerase specialized sigma24 family protein
MLAERVSELRSLSTEAVARGCRTEAGRFARGEPHTDVYALELLRRALAEDDAAAWLAFVAQYRGVVLASIRRQPAFALVHEDEHFWVDRTFERFWTAAGRDRLDRFPTLTAILRYLKMCAHSVLMDEARARRVAQHVRLEDTPEMGAPVEDVESTVLGEVAAHELWQVILAELPSEPERLVARLSLSGGMSPRQIQQRHPEWYPDVAQVYRLKRNAFERLRRSARVRSFRG